MAPVNAETHQYTIHIKDYIFHPKVLHVKPGDSVIYINDDDDGHTVTADDHSFDSGGIDTGEHWTHTFAKPGDYLYSCDLHPYVHGEVIVDPT